MNKNGVIKQANVSPPIVFLTENTGYLKTKSISALKILNFKLKSMLLIYILFWKNKDNKGESHNEWKWFKNTGHL